MESKKKKEGSEEQQALPNVRARACMRVCVRACVRACVRVCVCFSPTHPLLQHSHHFCILKIYYLSNLLQKEKNEAYLMN